VNKTVKALTIGLGIALALGACADESKADTAQKSKKVAEGDSCKDDGKWEAPRFQCQDGKWVDVPSPTTAPPTTEAPAPVKTPDVALGTTLDLTQTSDGQTSDYTVTLSNPRSAPKEPDEYGSDAENGLYVVVDAVYVVDKNAPKAVSVDPSEFKLIAPDGTAYERSYSSGWGPTIEYIDLQAGQRTAGVLVFDVKPGSEHGMIQQADGGFDPEPMVNWKLG
jgi:hypothetical protein